MPISLDCPRCRTNLTVPETLSGQYTICPNCQGRLWVSPRHSRPPQDGPPPATSVPPPAAIGPAAYSPPDIDPMAPVGPPVAATTGAGAGYTLDSHPPPSAHSPPPAARMAVTPPPVASTAGAASATLGRPPHPSTMAPAASPVVSRSAAIGREAAPRPLNAPSPGTPQHTAGPAVVPAGGGARSSRRVAKFITADVAQSQLTLAADGKLPELHLNLGESPVKKRRPLGVDGQWRILVLLAVSLGISLLVVLLPAGQGNGPSSEQDKARQRIEKIYFGRDDQELKPFQVCLRKAQQAHARRDPETERQNYQMVLSLLRNENNWDPDDKDPAKNVTGMKRPSSDGNMPNDEDLEKLISTLLRNP